ncbi:hypothetical protein FVEG_17647 [Fusarium verticillioides 7600]|uniref:Uncharacterized protein n=1 Tax=Gibberella moniliformis (strain M3125 / FGSC 7600) TaxID=334819 RepID=A0A139YBG9_GIBM7|nr:hypothetical protein FVEG_17647 [Fusarium verticillioides 7600]KYG13614.1 hypothetical protein FVEG_17647 [Fusarium verticillioides 7600]
MASTTHASLKRIRSTASLNDAAKILLRLLPPLAASLQQPLSFSSNRKLLNYFPFNQCKFPFVWYSAITSPRNSQLNCRVATNSTMASKKTNLKAGKSKSARNVSSETKSRNAVCLIPYRPMSRQDLRGMVKMFHSIERHALFVSTYLIHLLLCHVGIDGMYCRSTKCYKVAGNSL